MSSADIATVCLSEVASSAPDWVQLFPLGSIKARDGRSWAVGTKDDAERIVSASREAAGTVDPVIDYDHGSDLAAPKGQPALAAGWIKDFEVRPDGIWGRVEWTATARRLIGERAYRYLSPTFLHNKNSGQVLRIIRAALTNTPALELKALASIGASMNDLGKRLAALLGLSDDADDDAIVASVEKLKSEGQAQASMSIDMKNFVPRELYDGVLSAFASTKASFTDEVVKNVVNTAMRDGKLFPYQRDWAVGLCRSDPEALAEYLRTAPSFAYLTRLHCPSGEPSTKPGAAELSAEQLELCRLMKLDPAEYAKNIEG